MSEENKNMKGTYFISSISITSYMVEFGMSSVFILFLLYVLNFSMSLSSTVYAYYYGFAYLLPILIGYISDKYLDRSTSLTLGFIALIISQISLAFAASFYHLGGAVHNTLIFNTQTIAYMLGLFFLALGVSFTTLSFTHMINSVNTSEETRTKGFSIYYPIINMGIFFGSALMTLLIGDNNYGLYKVAFSLFAVLLTIWLICFRLFRNKYLVDNDGNLMKEGHFSDSIKSVSNNILSRVSNLSITEINKLNFMERIKLFRNSLNSQDIDRLKVFMVFLVLIILYRIAFSQTSISLVYFISGFVQRNVGPFILPVQSFSMLNPFFVLVLSPILIKINKMLMERGIDLGFVNRSIISILVLAFCFSILVLIGYYIDIEAVDQISFLWIVVFEFFGVISELYFAIAGYAMVGNLAPEKYYAMFFGLFTATRAIAMFLSGKISLFFPLNPPTIFIFNIPINGLMGFFLIFMALTLFAASVLIIFKKRIYNKLHIEGEIEN